MTSQTSNAGGPSQRQGANRAPARPQPHGAQPRSAPSASVRNGASQARPQQPKRGAPVKKQAPARKPTPKNNGNAKQAPEVVSVLHGAEALAALTVAESKLSRIKGKFILALSLMLCLSLGWNSIQSASRPEPKLLAMTNDGRVQPLPLLDEPLDSRQVLLDWVRRNVPSLYDFNYANYQSQLASARDFTQKVTLETFQQDLVDSGILTKVTDEFLILRANIVQDPIITSESVVNGRRLWVVEVPMNLVYDSGEVRDGQRRRITQEILFQAWIVRDSILEYDGGLMLAKYSVKSRRT